MTEIKWNYWPPIEATGMEIVCCLVSTFDGVQLLRASYILYEIWIRRNACIFGPNGAKSDSSLVLDALGRADFWWSKTTLEDDSVPRQRTIAEWMPPSAGWIKINYDLALPQDNSRFDVGWVARDESGSILKWGRKSCVGRPESFHGELKALEFAVSCAHYLGWQSVWFEGDNVEVANSVGDCLAKMYTPHDAVLQRLVAHLLLFNSVKVSFVYREVNTLAHNIVKRHFVLLEHLHLELAP